MPEIHSDLLHEFHLGTEELDVRDRFSIIREAYLSILLEDNLWHFFFEDEQGDILRCSPQYSEHLSEWLGTNYPDLEYDFTKSWGESIPEISHNPSYFAEMFHLNSVYIVSNSLTLGHNLMESMRILVDRFSHSLYLNYGFSIGKWEYAEGQMLSQAATHRAFFDGMRYQYKQMLPFIKEDEDGDKST